GVLAGPRQPLGPPLLIGGIGPKRTLPLVARHADIWNATQLSPDEFRDHSQRLDRLITEAGRTPPNRKRTLTAAVFVGRNESELEQRAAWLRSFDPGWANLPITSVLENMQSGLKSFMWGEPAKIVEQFQQYVEAGVEELAIQWGAFDDLEGLR